MENHKADVFNKIYVEHRLQLHRYLLRLTGDTNEAADLMQEAFLRCYERKVEPETARAWLYRTSYHLFVDQWRKSRKCIQISYELLQEPESKAEANPEMQLIEKETQTELMHALERLKPKAKEVLFLREWEGESYRDIADKIRCSENTVKSVVRRARLKMRDIVVTHYPELRAHS